MCHLSQFFLLSPLILVYPLFPLPPLSPVSPLVPLSPFTPPCPILTLCTHERSRCLNTSAAASAVTRPTPTAAGLIFPTAVAAAAAAAAAPSSAISYPFIIAASLRQHANAWPAENLFREALLQSAESVPRVNAPSAS
ncbi:unnamed protein product [Closterium sp. NIES-54]